MTVRTEPIKTIEELLDTVCARYCGACGAELTPRGSQCGECGKLPDDETREEARERLMAEPGAIPGAEAARLREMAAGYLVAAEQMFRAADDVEYRFELRRQRDEAQERLTEAADARDRAVEALAEAVKAEAKTAKPLEDAFRNHERAQKAEETARRLRKGAEAETEAVVRLRAAAEVLVRYQAEAATAARAREAAEVAAMQARELVRTREAERDQAQLMLDRHAAVPLSRITVFSLSYPLLRMAQGHDIDGRTLDQFERGMVGLFGSALHGAAFAEFAGALDQADEERIKRKLAEEAKNQPHLRNVGTGHLEASWLIAPKPAGGTPANAVVTPPPDVSPASPLGRPAAGFLPGLG